MRTRVSCGLLSLLLDGCKAIEEMPAGRDDAKCQSTS
jgi:hypothetical protein